VLLAAGNVDWTELAWDLVQRRSSILFEISSSHGGEYDVQNCLLGYTKKVKKVKQSLYTPWRRLGGEEI
jgi:hypothetical protein